MLFDTIKIQLWYAWFNNTALQIHRLSFIWSFIKQTVNRSSILSSSTIGWSCLPYIIPKGNYSYGAYGEPICQCFSHNSLCNIYCTSFDISRARYLLLIHLPIGEAKGLHWCWFKLVILPTNSLLLASASSFDIHPLSWRRRELDIAFCSNNQVYCTFFSSISPSVKLKAFTKADSSRWTYWPTFYY